MKYGFGLGNNEIEKKRNEKYTQAFSLNSAVAVKHQSTNKSHFPRAFG